MACCTAVLVIVWMEWITGRCSYLTANSPSLSANVHFCRWQLNCLSHSVFNCYVNCGWYFTLYFFGYDDDFQSLDIVCDWKNEKGDALCCACSDQSFIWVRPLPASPLHNDTLHNTSWKNMKFQVPLECMHKYLQKNMCAGICKTSRSQQSFFKGSLIFHFLHY